jgi:lipid A 4'-phosphatase
MPLLTHKTTLALLLAANIVIFALFAAMPGWDLSVSAAAYQQGQFVGDRGGPVHGLRMALWNMALILLLAAIIALSLGHSYGWPQRLLPMRQWNIILWGFLLGPGLVVNALLKGFSGRPRPVDTDLFGGAQPFAAVGDFSGACPANCSFVSGEVSGTTAFCLGCGLLIWHHRARLGGWLCAALALLLVASFGFVFAQRVASGGHYLSDALLAATLTALIFALVARRWPPGPGSPAAGAVDKRRDPL